MNEFKPEGTMQNIIYTKAVLDRAMLTGKILEAKVRLCDENHNLILDLGCMKGFIPKEEAALGIKEGTTRDIAIISRVNKICCFTVKGFRQINGELFAILSRTDAQQQALDHLFAHCDIGDIIDAKITHLDRFGAFADIGCGIVGLISIENISVSRISHSSDRFYIGQDIRVVVKDKDLESKRFSLTHKELLGTWQENAALFAPGQTVAGCVRSVEDYGIFVELTPNLSGLAELGEYSELKNGTGVSVYIKSIVPDKMKIKLSIVDVFRDPVLPPEEYKYFIKEKNIERFVYSVPASRKQTLTVFKKSDII
ncbi:MAG: S1 RNA-binding domain-containing protein [Ruminococcaceae bacterium]|nr:S1 RNA-binding domain-containing protein [Oscillospiraceae bacterium]